MGSVLLLQNWDIKTGVCLVSIVALLTRRLSLRDIYLIKEVECAIRTLLLWRQGRFLRFLLLWVRFTQTWHDFFIRVLKSYVLYVLGVSCWFQFCWIISWYEMWRSLEEIWLDIANFWLAAFIPRVGTLILLLNLLRANTGTWPILMLCRLVLLKSKLAIRLTNTVCSIA